VEALAPPSTPSLDGFLAAARELGASDLRLSAGCSALVRIEGQLQRFDGPPLLASDVEVMAREACVLAGEPYANDLDACFEIPHLGRFRFNAHVQRRGASISLKLVPRKLRELHELGLPEELYQLTHHRIGLVLVTGPTGCGKSSTLAALLQRVNETRRDHIVTIEDPIEFVFQSELANVTQRQVGTHTKSFASALRASLREDPDVILVAELRDLETIRTAILAAETGHLVLGTLHSTRETPRPPSTACWTCSPRASRRRSARCSPRRSVRWSRSASCRVSGAGRVCRRTGSST
jgi:twitching motility protein PilT